MFINMIGSEGYICVEADGVTECIVYVWLETRLGDVLKEIDWLSSSSCRLRTETGMGNWSETNGDDHVHEGSHVSFPARTLWMTDTHSLVWQTYPLDIFQ
ncbi:hypothetical protein CHS0354_014425 [Potamilus streckersoni]|uniref:Uncharacterized protein n=1 Tax=Potamilus streckersoni TaxID=2493646 RepID=A0AAE0VS08_9BIVA|nr:hypothetical protein CHS0354_014425 [Potamilus streckersoni]